MLSFTAHLSGHSESPHSHEPVPRAPSMAGRRALQLDEAVFAANGWPPTLTDAELLEHLLALNHQRAASEKDSSVS